MSTKFDGIVTVVTGGGSGIGAALCRRIAGPGRAITVHTGSNRANAERVAAEVVAAGGAAEAVVQNLSEHPDAAAAIIKATIEQFGRLAQVVHLAAYADRRPIGILDAAGFEQSMSTSATALFHLMTGALRYLNEARVGRSRCAGPCGLGIAATAGRPDRRLHTLRQPDPRPPELLGGGGRIHLESL